jgi:lipoprotein-anchoring transpeptidase ErfK/SrfK
MLRDRMHDSTPRRFRRFLGLLLAAATLVACPSADPDHSATQGPPAEPLAPAPEPSAAPQADLGVPQEPATKSDAPPLDPAAHAGPWLWVKRSSAGVFDKPTADREGKIGYYKRGAKVPVLPGSIEAPGCPKGWLQVLGGGVICSMVGTTDEKDPVARFSPRQPKLDDVLPYPYARNARNGTPLYKSLPSRKQMYQYEPYLPDAKEAKVAEEEERARDLEQMKEAGLGVGGEAATDKEPEVPLWEREENLHEVTLDDLRRDADDVLAQRMMKGFYVAVDKTFKWNGRTWYKTTKGLVAPADAFWQTAGPAFQGIEIDGEKWSLPVGFVMAGVKAAPTYRIDVATKQVVPSGSVEKLKAVQLSYDYLELAKTEYYRMQSGDWIRDAHVRVTTPGPRPKEVSDTERWIDVDISEQTLVVFEGDRPLYATLISSGKESKIKDQDHATPRGMWRVREKHTVSTMDGNGSAAGDMPYSIEDVPYIMYFHKSYATHGAFWHQNFGSQMSHGCVNLAPLDAKWLYFNTAPGVPAAMHGAWSSEDRPGSWVVVHD